MSSPDPDIEQLCEAVGYSATRLLSAWFASSYLHVPTTASGDHPLVSLIGLAKLRALVAALGGCRVWMPAVSEDQVHHRDRLVAELLASGVPEARVASLVDLRQRRIEALRLELEARGILVYAGGYRRRSRGAPVGGARPAPELPV